MTASPPPAAPSLPLTDPEISELDELLLELPEDRDPLDVAMLDGFLVGVLLQPDVVAHADWLPLVFDADGRAIAFPGGDAALHRATELITRRHDELAAAIAAREPFDPVVFDIEDDDGNVVTDARQIAALEPWAIGFVNALNAFPALADRIEQDEAATGALVGLLRHLPLDPDADDDEAAEEMRQERAALDRDSPLATLDDAIEDLVTCVLDLADVTRPRRPVERSGPKVGRNDPCHCGSGRKFKHCHGRSVH
jgi:uncharacterized protein